MKKTSPTDFHNLLVFNGLAICLSKRPDIRTGVRRESVRVRFLLGEFGLYCRHNGWRRKKSDMERLMWCFVLNGNTFSCGLGVASGQAYKDGNQLKVPVMASTPNGSVSTGYDAWINYKNVLTSHTNCVAGLSRYSNGTRTRLYYKGSDDDFYDAGYHCWYYKDTKTAPTTYYE